MKKETFMKVKKISKIDTIEPFTLLRIYETLTQLFYQCNEEEERTFLAYLEELGIEDIEKFSQELLKLCGFENDDEIADGFISEYCFSTEDNKLDVLKKSLIEWAMELEEIEEEEQKNENKLN